MPGVRPVKAVIALAKQSPLCRPGIHPNDEQRRATAAVDKRIPIVIVGESAHAAGNNGALRGRWVLVRSEGINLAGNGIGINATLGI
jgi:hypothetical protein